MFENQMLLYVSDRQPSTLWMDFARRYNCHLVHEKALMRALGAYVMLMPAITVLDKESAVATEALFHLEDVLYTPPLKQLVIELCDCQCISRKERVVRACMDQSANHAQLKSTLQGASSLLSDGFD